MPKSAKFRRVRYLYAIPCLAIISTAVSLAAVQNRTENAVARPQSRCPLVFDGEGDIQCIPSGIDSFPADFFTQEQRLEGGVVIHFLILIYICAMIATVCDGYFVPTLEIISEKLKLSPDVAGATFMAMGASAPELFSSIAGAFITEGDIGVGTIIGSAVFNILGITGVVGLVLWNEVLDIDWYPVVRDCIVYGVTLLAVLSIISDNIVTWRESTILLAVFFLYIFMMHFNGRIAKCTKNSAKEIISFACCRRSEKGEKKALLATTKLTPVPLAKDAKTEKNNGRADDTVHQVDITGSETLVTHHIDSIEDGSEDNEGNSLCSPPRGNPWSFVWWVVMYPASILFYLTIPSPSTTRFRCLFPITFITSVMWMGSLSYLAVWMVTIIGYTFSVPDSVAGLTILAAGSSVPDLIASVSVARSGFGNMAISNLVGSNTFDLGFCLGAPWLVKTLVSEKGYLVVYSSAMTYTTATLFITLLAFFLTFLFSGWRLNRTVGFICLLFYIMFVVLACLYELNVFGEINIPPCRG